MNMLRKIFARPVVRSVTVVAVVIIIFFITLLLTLPDIGKPKQKVGSPTVTPVQTAGSVESTPTESPAAGQLVSETKFSTKTTLHDMGISSVTLRGLYGKNSIWVPLQANWIVENLLVNLHYSPSPLLKAGRANLNVLVNGQQITSFNLSGANEQTVTFAIPVEYVDQGDGFLLSFDGYLRLTDILCEEIDNPSQWVKILDTTELTINANPKDIPPVLENMSMLMTIHEKTGGILFVLPDSPDLTVLSTASSVAARLGLISGKQPISVVTSSSLPNADLINNNIVVIGIPDNMPMLTQIAGILPAPLAEGSYLTLDGASAPAEHGIVQIMRSPWNADRTLLVVSAGNEEGLTLAGNAFASNELFNTLTAEFQFIKTGSPLRNSLATTPWRYSEIKLSDFGYKQNRELDGLGASDVTFYLPWPPGWTVVDGSQLHLSVITSPAIKSTSHLIVYINGVLVGVSSIDPSTSYQSLTIDLPAEAINETLTGSQLQTMKLGVRAINILDTDECDYGNDITAWVQIASDSYFSMAHGYSDLPNLKVFPYPFVSDKSIQPISIVLPDDPTEQEISYGLTVSEELGHYSVDDFDIHLLTSSQLNSGTYGDSHIIVLGVNSRQPWVDKFMNRFPQIPDDGVYQALDEGNIGVIIEGVSPWNANRMVLLISSQTDTGFEQGLDLLMELNEMEQPSAWIQYDIK